MSACGDRGISDSPEQLQKQSPGAAEEGAEDRDDIPLGKVDAEAAAKDLQKDANKLNNDAIDASKDTPGMTDDIEEALERAKQIDAAADGG